MHTTPLASELMATVNWPAVKFKQCQARMDLGNALAALGGLEDAFEPGEAKGSGQ